MSDSTEAARPRPQRRTLARRLRGLIRMRRNMRRSANVFKSVLGPRIASSKQTLRQGAGRAGQQVREFQTQRLSPGASRFGRRLIGRLHPKSLVRDYRRILLLIQTGFVDRKTESLFFVPTRGRVTPVRLNIPSQVRASAHDYKPTPRLVFRWAMSALPDDLRRTAFVDYGAGRGRVLLLASHYPFETITGAEIALELHDECMMNIAQYPRSLMKCRNVECQHTRATTLPIPDQPVVFYFFNPFDRSVFKKVMARIERSYKRERREMHLILVDMGDNDDLELPGIFYPVPFPRKDRLKIAVFSPYSVKIFKTSP
ncbi:MAG: hypothetical protein OEM91_02550 [Hyphomicrobiales bacterium]|nr:hypothetical protein [Hyphomicrobiales bacterium]